MIIRDKDPPESASNGGGYRGHKPGRKTPGEVAGERARRTLKDVVNRIAVVEMPGDGIKDAAQWCSAHPGTRTDKAIILGEFFENALKHGTQRAKRANVIGGGWLAAAIKLTLEHPAYGKVRKNLLNDTVELADGTVVTEYHQIDLVLHLQSNRLDKAGKTVAWDAMLHIATGAAYDPLLDHIDSLPAWDGVKRLNRWLTIYCCAEDTEYHRNVGRWFLISMMARAHQPGCQVDHVLCLESGQGEGKSKLCRILGGPFYAPMNAEVSTKDACLGLRGKWLMEFPDLGKMTKGEINHVKAFISTPTDYIVPKYANQGVDIRRRVVFIVTFNDDNVGWLDDPTGARRFWPVTVDAILTDILERDRDQLLAEAAKEYHAGARWWPERADWAGLQEHQEVLQQVDPWHSRLAINTAGLVRASTSEALAWLDVPIGQQTRAHEMRVAKVLKNLGFKRVQRTIDGRRDWVYER